MNEGAVAVRFSARTEFLSLLDALQNGSGAHSAPYLVGAVALSRTKGGRVVKLVLRLRMCGVIYIHCL
jgi:hypothetical protein